MTLFLIAVSLLYALFTLILWITWVRIPFFKPLAAVPHQPYISVVIPVRNEANTIGKLLADLNQQSYPQFEVIVADDSSSDHTVSIVRSCVQSVSFNLQLLALTDEPTSSPKKRAISQSIAQAKGDLIVTTDGDCRVGPAWLATIASFYQSTGAKLISGPVTFTAEHTVSDSLQTVEFASLIGSGACTMALGMPTMCNGANLCYEKQAFSEVGGFSGIDHIASGDDEFLMHKIANRYPKAIRFLKSPEAIVSTSPHQSWKAFYNQRKRWASKWRMYQSWGPSLLAVFIFLSNAAPVLAVVAWLFNTISSSTALLVIGLKALPEFLFLRQVLLFLQKNKQVPTIPLTQLIYPVYVVFFGLVAQQTGYYWKDRKLK
ncbi:glycosyltransferase [Spirosoma sp. SC4-14]|uniref:glycosyltransferase family 2 protein n=1 Tax=Spirosoma sp. SC4-14 TaxID=3128900 RepID=UPI0030CA7BEA